MSTQTPKTDEIITAFHEGWYPKEWGVSADFARSLERENAELRGNLERLAVYWADIATEAGLGAKEHARLGDTVGRVSEFTRSVSFRACSAQLRAILNEGSK